MNAKYYAGGNGRRFLYNSDPTLVCPYAEAGPAWMHDALEESEESAVAEGDKPLGLDLVRVFKLAHQRGSTGPDPDDPSRCRCCRTFMDRKGFYAWIEEPWPSARELERETKRRGGWAGRSLSPEQAEACAMAVSSALSTRSLNLGLGHSHRVVPGSGRYFATKVGRDGAIAWAREQAQIDKAAARDEARQS